MATRYGFFDAVKSGSTYDRVYSSENFCDYLGSIVGNGVQDSYGDALEASLSDTLNSFAVADGKAWIDGHYLIRESDDTTYGFTSVITPTSGYYGYAILCAYLDMGTREMGFTSVAGNTAAEDTGTPPEMTSDYTADKDGITYTDSNGKRYIPIAAAKIEYGSAYATDIVDMRDGRYMQCILGKCPQKLEAITTLENTVSSLQTQIDTMTAEIETLSGEITVASQIVGDDVLVTGYANGNIKITGTGEITSVLSEDFTDTMAAYIKDNTATVVFSGGITSIISGFGIQMGSVYNGLSLDTYPTWTIPATVESIGTAAITTNNIIYGGTMAQWIALGVTNKICFGEFESYTVTCSDGVLSWNGLEWEEQ